MRARVLLGVGLLAVSHAVVIAAGFLAPCDPAEQFRRYSLSPPAQLALQGWRPGFLWSDPGGRREWKPLRFLVPGAPYSFLGMSFHIHLFGGDEPARPFLLGTDEFGRDLFSRMLYGGRVSLFSGIVGATLSVCLGLLLGLLAGYYGGFADALIMRASELFLALPWIYLLLGVRALLPLRLSPESAFVMVIAVLGSVGWSLPARLVRGAVLNLRSKEFVLAARGFGASDAYILRRHVVPNLLPVLLPQWALLSGKYILAETTLSYLGLGVSEPVPSWGNMLSAVQHYHVLAGAPWLLAPALALLPVTIGYFVLASGVLAQSADSARI